MIISRTPLRISFFGGGTDYPAWFEKNGGAVLATAIDKYIYITCRYLPPFFEHKSRIVWSLIELVKDTSKIEHPSVRECLKFMKIEKGIEIHCDADLPSRTGLGSSSSFTVGLLNSLYALKGTMVSKEQLAKDAIYVEQDLIKENVGSQDQILASFGGFNLIEFKPGSDFRIFPVILDSERLKLFHSYLMLVFTGFTRIASEVAGELVKKTPEKKVELKTMYAMVYEAIKILNSNTDLLEFGKLLNENWKLKRSLSDKITTPVIDEIYSLAQKAGATGGKLLGAGGGGFLLLFAEPEVQPKIKSELKQFLHVPFQFENLGSQIIFYNP
jgi:D-glycero-alpha-D-manno-heptose-7-phosphate kinase